MKLFITTILFLSTAFLVNGQSNTAPFVEGDDKNSVFTFNTNYPIPKRSALYSALVPGLGQVYNKQYWKLGLVGAGLAAAGYFITTNGEQYNSYRKAYIARIDNDPNTTDEYVNIYQTTDLNTLQNQSRQLLEYSIIFTTVGYALNILDAYVASSLRSFDISDDISFNAQPSFQNKQLGLALVFKIK